MSARIVRLLLIASVLMAGIFAIACGSDDDAPLSTARTAVEAASPTATATRVPGDPFTPERLAVGNQVVTVSGYRTETETVIDIAMPPGVRLTDEPTLMVGGYPAPAAGGGQEQAGGTPVAAQAGSGEANGHVELHFGMTPAGEPVAVNLGVFAVDDSAPPISVTVAVGDVLRRNGATSKTRGSYPIEPGDVIDGPPGFALSVDQPDTYHNGKPAKLLGVTVKGLWRPGARMPELFDQDGNQLLVRDLSANDMRTDTGQLLPDKTTISTDAPDLSKFKTIKVVLGPAQDVESWARSVILQPQS